MLRDYQRACLDTVLASYRAGIRRQLVCLPTGTGKTVIFSQFPRFFRLKKRMLVLAHREELLDQARDKILRTNPDLKVEVEQADRRASPTSDVVVASVASLGRRVSSRIAQLDPEDFYLIVVDEAHHATSPTFRRALEHFGVFASDTKKLVVGFTATPKRGDGQGLDEVFQEIVFARGLPEMVREGHLAPLAGFRVESDIDLRAVKIRMGDFVPGQLSRAVNVEGRNALVVKVYHDLLAGKRTLCFCADVAHAKSLAEAFSASGVRAAAVSGEMHHRARAKVLSDFRTGVLQVVTNCMVLTEGYDEPAISGIVARPTRSLLLYTQMIGRGARLHPGKQNGTVIDIIDQSDGKEPITLPAVFGLPRTFDLEGRTTAQAQDAFDWVEQERPLVRADLSKSISDLRYRCQRIDVRELETPPEIRGCSRLVWAASGANAYRLYIGAGELIEVAPTLLGSWEVVLRGVGAQQEIAKTPNIGTAIDAADRFVEEKRPTALRLVERSTAWREEPISEKQHRFLEQHKIAFVDALKRGQTSHVIAALRRRPPRPVHARTASRAAQA